MQLGCGKTCMSLLLQVTAQVILGQGYYFQRFEILKTQGAKGRRPLENQGFVSILGAKINQKLT